MVKVKNCLRIALPTPLIPTSTVLVKSVPSTPPPVPISKVVPSAPPPVPISKIVPSTPPSSAPPPTKKSCPQPFIRGQVSHKFFSLSQPRTYTKILDGCSLIIAGFQKPLPHETVKNKYIILDPFSGTWCAPRVFDVWREEVDSGALTSNEFTTHRVALVQNGVEFFLAFSDRKSHINNVLHEIQQDPSSDDDAFPNVDTEDEREKRDPDFLPSNESD